ncbi:MAG: nuclear transport factor 2 family protein, partial [Chloroflexota bacterium]
GRDAAARTFMNRLRSALPKLPIALSSYRYPTYHPTFPWVPFLEKVDINMPQVYWVEAANPGEQLLRCQREFQAITPFRPIIPTGSAYLQGSWRPTPAQITEFMDTARSLNMAAANFWEWAHTRQYLPDLWDTIAAYSWPAAGACADLLQCYFAALNARSLDQLSALYLDNAVIVTAERTIQGAAAIREWFAALFQQLPNAVFKLGAQRGDLSTGALHFSWTASTSAGTIASGQDSLGIVDRKIAYHYAYFTRSS